MRALRREQDLLVQCRALRPDVPLRRGGRHEELEIVHFGTAQLDRDPVVVAVKRLRFVLAEDGEVSGGELEVLLAEA